LVIVGNNGLPTDPYALAKAAATAILERFDVAALDVAFVLGSGWSAAADDLGQADRQLRVS
jgi:purine-nucleoside phosphorylase